MGTEAAGERMTFKVPREAVAVVLVVLLAPFVVVLAPLMWRYPSLRTADLVIALAVRGLPWLGIALLFSFIRVPVVVDARGIRFAWVFWMPWSDVTGARIRKFLGFRVLEISRRSGFTWRPLLRMYSDLPDFLARRAPEGSPLRLLRNSTDKGESS